MSRAETPVRSRAVATCSVRDTIAVLREQLKADGTMIGSSQWLRLHPAITEIRAQQLALARLLATLSAPALAEDSLPASRGVRGVCPMTSAS